MYILKLFVKPFIHTVTHTVEGYVKQPKYL